MESKKEYVTVRLPISRNEREDVYVAVNGRSYLIKRGEPVQVPACVAEVLLRKEQMLEQSLRYEAEAASEG
jgi:hypothetical protein